MRTTRWAVMATMVASAVLLHVTPARAQYNFCFGPTIQRGVPNPVLTDGKIASDNGWLNAFTYRGGDGVPDANIRVLGNTFKDANNHQWLALGIEALNDTQFDKGDAVVILYKIKNQNSYGQIVVAPLQDDQAPASIVNPRPGSSNYYTSSNGSTWTAQAGGAPPWVTWGATATASGGACTGQNPGTACLWTVEIGIDTSAAGAPADLERIYIDVVEVIKRAPAQSRQFSWPPGNILVDANETTTTPATSAWGTASVGSTTLCKGVHFGYADISAAPVSATGRLTPGVEETFTVKLHNSGTDARGVKAHFAHAPYGVCGLVESCFQPFGSTTSPTSCPNGAAPPNCCSGAAGCVPPDPNNAGTAMQVKWTPTPADAGHQCIRVTLEATVGDTTFVNRGDFHNMWVDSASTVTVEPRINLKGMPPPVGGGAQRVRVFSQETTQFAFADGGLAKIPAGTLTSQIIKQYRVARYTGKYVTVAGTRSEVWEPVGSYGFKLQHALRPELQQAFLERHRSTILKDKPILSDAAKMARDTGAIAALNATLLQAAERPAATDWKFQIQRSGTSKALAATDGPVFDLELPADGEVTLPTVATFTADGEVGPGPGSGSSAGSGSGAGSGSAGSAGSTPPATPSGKKTGCCSAGAPTSATFGLAGLVGLALLRRRRPRRA